MKNKSREGFYSPEMIAVTLLVVGVGLLAGLEGAYAQFFSTSTIPANADFDVPVNDPILIDFNNDVEPTSVTPNTFVGTQKRDVQHPAAEPGDVHARFEFSGG